MQKVHMFVVFAAKMSLLAEYLVFLLFEIQKIVLLQLIFSFLKRERVRIVENVHASKKNKKINCRIKK
jgi:hypothetical protein